MYINFKIEKLDKLLYDFYKLTGLTISVWNSSFNQLSFQPKQMCDFCAEIKKNKEGKRRCYVSDKMLCTECARVKNAVTHRCHAGLIDTAVPIIYDGNVLGYLIFGQAVDGSELSVDERLKNLCEELSLDFEKMSKYYSELLPYDLEKIIAASNILKTAARYLWLSEYIEIGYSTKASQISDYITENLGGDLSLSTLCLKFGISKNKLYEISRHHFKTSIGDYITQMRITEAKRLLTSTDLSVREVGESVGIKDYNYFTKFFKNNVGQTPIKYRKNYPFNLHDNV